MGTDEDQGDQHEEQQYYMPAEYDRHIACMLLYPHNPNVFRGEQCHYARKAFRDVARAIAYKGNEDVHMFCNTPEDADELRGSLEQEHEIKVAQHGDDRIFVHVLPSDDSWCRDTGPTFVFDQRQKSNIKLTGVDWDFNAYGGPEEGCYWPCDKDSAVASGTVSQISKHYNLDISVLPRRDVVLEGGSFHTDGDGTIIVTEECLLNPNRNPQFSKAELEQIMLKQLGGTKVIWFKRGLYKDEDTNGHIDNIACFTSPANIALAWTDDKTDPQYDISQECYQILQNSTDAKGRTINVHKLHCPPPLFYTKEEVDSLQTAEDAEERVASERLAASYANFYIANDAVIVPGFGHEASDNAAVEALESLFSTRSVVQIPSREIVLGGGNIHCITQQIPSPAVDT
jgi:agmatine deiminase